MKIRKPKLICFDLDDTIIHSSKYLDKHWIDTSKKMFGDKWKLVFDEVNNQRKWFWKDKKRHKSGRLSIDKARLMIVENALNKLDMLDKKIAKTYTETVINLKDSTIELFPNAVKTLKYFNEQGLRLFLVTNGESSKQRFKINKFNLEEYFEHILIEGEVGFGKPEKEAFDNIINLAQLDPEEIWFVGDKLEWEVFEPMKIGMTGIWNNYNKVDKKFGDQKPDLVINYISELMDVFDRLDD